MSRCGLRKFYLGCKKVIFSSYFTVNRTRFSNQLAYGKMTLLNFSFMFRVVQSENSVLFRRYEVKLYFIVAKEFHFSKSPSAHNFHSLLRHLFTSEFAVLLFDCERYKLAAESIQ